MKKILFFVSTFVLVGTSSFGQVVNQQPPSTFETYKSIIAILLGFVFIAVVAIVRRKDITE